MTTTEQAPPVELPTADSPEGQAIIRGLFRQAWAALPPDVLARACAAMAADDEPTIDSTAALPSGLPNRPTQPTLPHARASGAAEASGGGLPTDHRPAPGLFDHIAQEAHSAGHRSGQDAGLEDHRW